MSKKADNLVELARHGIRVPVGFHLDDSHYREAIQPVLVNLISAVQTRTGVAGIFGHVELSQRTRRTLQEKLNQFSQSSLFAVRSSGEILSRGKHIREDGNKISLAGQFESFLNVPRDQVPFAVIQCWASLFNDRSLQVFQADADYVNASSMTVLIQEMVAATASAVVMTVDPLEDGTLGGIEVTFGPCEAIVSGAVSPDEVTFHRSNGTIAERRIGAKEFAIEYELFSCGSDNQRKTSISLELRKQMAVPDRTLDRIIDIARSVEGVFGCPQDIELVIDDSDEIIVVQSRPIFRLPDEFVSFGIPAH